MAHQIFQDRRMFFSGATPWHGLGTKLPANAAWADVSPMFPDVHERPLVAAGGLVVPDMKALVCSADGRYLSTVGADYHVVQAETVAGAILTAAREAGAIFHTGGLLGERGNRGWLLGELPESEVTIDGDNSPIKAYFLGYWGHDGRTAVTLANVSTRVVCANTVAAALGERTSFKVSVRHTSGAQLRVEEAADSFAGILDSNRKLARFANEAASTKLIRNDVMAALDAFFPVEEKSTQRELDKRDAAQTKVVELLQGPTVSPNHRNTAWGLMQAMSEFSEHYASRLTDAQKQVDSIAQRAIDGIGRVQLAYQTVANVVGLTLPR